jgi:hypothetical protein
MEEKIKEVLSKPERIGKKEFFFYLKRNYPEFNYDHLMKLDFDLYNKSRLKIDESIQTNSEDEIVYFGFCSSWGCRKRSVGTPPIYTLTKKEYLERENENLCSFCKDCYCRCACCGDILLRFNDELCENCKTKTN